MKKLLLFFAMCASVTTWAQTVVKDVSADGKTLTLTCSGDVSQMPDVEVPTGKKIFTEAAKEGNQYGKVLKSNGDMASYPNAGENCSQGTPYYLKVYNYTDSQTPNTIENHSLKQNVYQLDGTSAYVLKKTGESIDATKTFYNLNDVNAEEIDDQIVQTYASGYLFGEKSVNYVYLYKTVTDQWGNSWNEWVSVAKGDSFVSDGKYKITNQPYSWDCNNVSELENAQQTLIDGKYLINAISSEANFYVKHSDGSYQLAAGTEYDSSLKYYNGISFEEISNITTSEYTILAAFINETQDNWHKKVTENGEDVYYPVKNGDPYDANATYVQSTGATASDAKTIAELEAMGFVTDEMGSVSYWLGIANECNAKRYETLILKGVDGGELPLITNVVTHELMKCTTVKTLDLGGVAIDKLVSPYINSSSHNPDGTFIYNTNAANLPYSSEKNNVLEVLVLPYLQNVTKEVNGKDHYHVPSKIVDHYLTLKEVHTPANATCLEHDCFSSGSNGFILNKIILNEGLERIGDNAFIGVAPSAEADIPKYITTLTIPSTVKYIGKNVFNQGTIRDIYFVGKDAPIVETDAFGSKSYVNNNAYTRVSAATDWKGTRENYKNGGYLAAMLHMPTDLTLAQRAAYTDITRDYHVFDLYPTSQVLDPATIVVNASAFKSPEIVAVKEYERITDPTHTYYDYISKYQVIWNKKLDEGYTLSTAGKSNWDSSTGNSLITGYAGDTQSWGNISGFYDTYVGENYAWPCQDNMNHSFTVASNGVLWDLQTTIGQGIINAGGTCTTVSYDSDCDGTDDVTFEDGKQYIGLHQFLFTTYDVAPETTPEIWSFDFEGANWWTLCVPVNMTVAEVRKAFGEETQVCMFNGVSRQEDDKVKFYFTDEQCLGKDNPDAIAVVANYPYMIRPSKAKDATYKFELPNYTVSPDQFPIPVSIKTTDKTNGKQYTYTYVGQYNTQVNGDKLYMPQYCYYLGAEANNPTYHKLFFQVGTTGKWKPFTCVILPSDGKDDYDYFFDPNRTFNNVKSVSSAFGLDDYEFDGVSGIMDYEIVCGSENSGEVYNLNGQKVNPNNLKKGIYIKNGSKIYVK